MTIPEDEDDYEYAGFNQRIEVLDDQPYLVIDLPDGGGLIFTPENWLAFMNECNDALAFGLKQNAPVSNRLQ